MVSKLCSRSQGQPSGARSRAMTPTRRSNLSPVVVGLVGIAGCWNSHCGTGVLVCVAAYIRLIRFGFVFALYCLLRFPSRRGSATMATANINLQDILE